MQIKLSKKAKEKFGFNGIKSPEKFTFDIQFVEKCLIWVAQAIVFVEKSHFVDLIDPQIIF